MDDTIVAISTAQVEGAISIIRLSGAQAIELVDKVFASKVPLKDKDANTISYGKVVDPATGNPLDEVLVSLFRAPRTYTREDVVEINCHGGVEITQQILLLMLRLGARLAEPGEFTKRAFLNGRIDLTQAEAVSDMIAAESKNATELAINTLSGKLSEKIISFREQAVDVLAAIEVNIDYPEYDDVETMTADVLVPKVQTLIAEMEELLKTANTGQILRNGIRTVIIGKPNVGKSSLLNTLLQEQKAIVTDVAGTTRDIVEGHLRIGELTLHMIDTAGIRETEDIVEQIGIQKSKEVAETAELILLMLDGSRPLDEEDQALLTFVEGRNHLVLVNKLDLPQQMELPAHLEGKVVSIAAEHDTGIDKLYEGILALLQIDLTKSNQLYLSNIRHISLLEQAKSSFEQARASSEMGMPIDVITIDLQSAYSDLGEILGISVQDDLLNTLFSKFCLGK